MPLKELQMYALLLRPNKVTTFKASSHPGVLSGMLNFRAREGIPKWKFFISKKL